MTHRVQTALTWSGVLSLLGLLVTVVAAAAKAGAIAERLEQKVEKEIYQQDQKGLERRLGEMQGDIRVIRSAVCARNPGACQ